MLTLIAALSLAAPAPTTWTCGHPDTLAFSLDEAAANPVGRLTGAALAADSSGGAFCLALPCRRDPEVNVSWRCAARLPDGSTVEVMPFFIEPSRPVASPWRQRPGEPVGWPMGDGLMGCALAPST